MKKVLLLIVPLLLLASCKDSEAESNVRQNWPERNVQWFAEVYDAARAEIETAKAQYGNDWEEHCNWRVYKTLLKSQDVQGPPSDYVVCKINEKGDGDWSPAYTDSVRLYYRGWIMDDNYPASKDNMTVLWRLQSGDSSTGCNGSIGTCRRIYHSHPVHGRGRRLVGVYPKRTCIRRESIRCHTGIQHTTLPHQSGTRPQEWHGNAGLEIT